MHACRDLACGLATRSVHVQGVSPDAAVRCGAANPLAAVELLMPPPSPPGTENGEGVDGLCWCTCMPVLLLHVRRDVSRSVVSFARVPCLGPVGTACRQRCFV